MLQQPAKACQLLQGLAVEREQRPEAGAHRPHKPPPRSRTVARQAEQLTHEPATDQATNTCTTMQQVSNTPPRTKTMFWPLRRSIWSRETPGHRRAGCPNPLWMQAAFWVSCFTSSLLRKRCSLSTRELCLAARHPQGTRTSSSCV